MHGVILLGTAEVASAQQSQAKMDPIRELQVKRVEKLRLLQKQRLQRYMAGAVSYEMMAPAFKWLLDAELELCETKAERIAIHEKLIEVAEKMLAIGERQHRGGAVSGDELT